MFYGLVERVFNLYMFYGLVERVFNLYMFYGLVERVFNLYMFYGLWFMVEEIAVLRVLVYSTISSAANHGRGHSAILPLPPPPPPPPPPIKTPCLNTC